MSNQLLKFIHKMFLATDARGLLCFSQLVLSLIKERTVNLSRLSLHCSRRSKRKEARYRRLQRFITQCPLTQYMIARLIMSFAKGPVLLALDRTNWRLGLSDINILVLSWVYKGNSFPLFWKLIPHKGCSAPEDRSFLIKQFLKEWGKERIQALVADREFIGSEWLGFLIKEDIPFHIRLKNNTKIGRGKGEMVPPKETINQLKCLEKIDLPGRRKIGLHREAKHLFVSICKSAKNDLVMIVSNQDQSQALERYKLRWGIETLFSCLKTRGFCFEDTRLKEMDKISNLLLVLSFTFFWAFRVGDWLNDFVPIKLKTHQRKAISIFRYGLNALILAKNAFKKWFLLPMENKPSQAPPKNLMTFIGYACK